MKKRQRFKLNKRREKAKMTKQTNSNINVPVNATVGLKFGFIGLGMAGCNIAAECAKYTDGNGGSPYSAVLVNTNIRDFSKVKHKKDAFTEIRLSGYEGGAGRNIEKGEKAFIDNKEEFLNAINPLADRDFIWVVAGLGGGTGTGALIEAVLTLAESGYADKLGLILTLPRHNEGGNVLGNAFKRIQEIGKIKDAIGSIIIVDNQKLYTDYLKKEENKAKTMEDFLTYCNRYVADTLHELNTITNAYENMTMEYFDSSEFENTIKQSGYLTLSKLTLIDKPDVSNEAQFVNKLKASIQNGVLSDGYNFETAQTAAVTTIANGGQVDYITNMAFESKVKEVIDSMAPYLDEYPVAGYKANNTVGVNIYTIFTGLETPTCLGVIGEKYDEFIKAKNAAKKNDEVLDRLNSLSHAKKETNKPKDLRALLSGNSKEDEDSSNNGSSLRGLLNR